MGTVKYSGPVASFHCPTNAEIRSLKVHFSPKQEGSGDPSPENVRPIVGWDSVEAYQTGKNLIDISNNSYSCPFSNNVSGGTIPSDFIFENGEFSGTVSQGTRDLSVFTSNRAYPPGTYTLSYDYENNAINANWRPILIAVGNKGSNWFSAATNCSYNGVSGKGHFVKTFTAVTPIYFNLSLNNYGNAETTAKNRIYNIKLELDSIATPYESYHGSTTNYEFGVLGKNKFDKSQCIDGARLMKTDGSNYTNDSANCYISPFIPVVSGATYTKNSPIIDAYHRFATYTSNDVSSFVRVLDNSNTIIIEPNETYIRFCGLITEKDTAQFELGSTATTYEPYDPKHTVYGGWVDLISGEVCEEWKLFDLTALSLTQFSIGQSVLTISAFPGAIKSRNEMYCNFLPPGSNPNISGVEGVDWNNSRLNICLSVNRDLDTQAKVEQWLADMKTGGTTPMIVANMVTPNTYHIAPTQLQTFLGQNNVWSNADYVEVEYDLHETQDILARKQFIIANQPHIVKPAAASLQNFVTDMAAPLKECKVYFEPVQEGSGDPSPDNIRPITGWTGVEVTRCGKNFSTAATGTEMVQKWPIISSGSSRTFILSGLEPGQEFTLSASFTKASEPSSNKRLYLVGSQKANSTTNSIFTGPSIDGPVDRIIHNWVDTDGTIRITHNNRGLTYNDDFIEYAASLQNIQLELGDTATAFEPYNGTTIPITFPSVINVLNSTTITANKTLSAAGEETSETGMSLTNYIKVNEGDTYKLTFTSKEGARTRRIYGYDANKEPVESLASASWVSVDSIGTLTTTIPSGIDYIRVCYKTADENIFLEGPESSVIYGGYVDLVKGEVIEAWGGVTLNSSMNAYISGGAYRGTNCTDIWFDAGTYAWGYTTSYTALSASNSCSNKLKLSNKAIWGSPDSYPWCYTLNSYNQIHCVFVNSVVGITDEDTNSEAIEKIRAWIDNNPIVIKYKLSDSKATNYPITSQILKTLRGTNNIWASNGGGNIELAYWSH